MLEPGDPAPTFTLPDQRGEPVSLTDFEGQPVVLYFYPKDETPGCTTQACGIRDQWTDFEEAGVVVLGVSPDSVESHRSFTEHHSLPHTLLADPDHEVMETYGAWGEKNMYGKVTVGPIRSTVLIGPDGRIVKRWKRVQAAKHAEQVLKAIDRMKR
jgi:peroxiredoxin Q/BCP